MECVFELDLTCCENLLCLPNTIGNLKSLKILNISECTKVCALPDNINENKALEDLDLSRTSVREVNSSLFRLENLKRLSFSGCSGPGIKSQGLALPFGWKCRVDHASSTTPESLILPRFVSGLSSLTSLDLSDCNLSYGLIPEDLGHLSSLERLILSGNKNLELPADHCFANLSKLSCLELEGCMLRSRPVLPPHARIYPDDFDVEACSLDPRKLWKLFEPSDSESFEPRESETDSLLYIFFNMRERFNDQIFFPLEQKHVAKLYSSASPIVNIPNGYRMGEWWGIAVFVALDPPMSSALSSNPMAFCWSFEPPRPEAGPSLYLCSYGKITHGNCYLLTMIMNDSFIFFQQHSRQYHKRSEREYFRVLRMPEFSENSTLHVEVKVKRRKIREFGWHVLRKEDFQSQTTNSEGSSRHEF